MGTVDARPRALVRGWGVETTVLVLLVGTVVVGYTWLPDDGRLLVEPAVALGVVALARRSGLTWDQLGLAPSRLRSGLRWGLAAAGAVALGVVAVAALPLARHLLYDASVLGRSAVFVMFAAAVRLPLGTVLPEELIFRGVVFGLLRRRMSVTHATVLGSLLFALWHVGVVLGTGRRLPALTVLVSPLAQGAGFVGVLAATFCAGVAFTWLRWRSGSLAAPVLAHWAANGLMLWLAWVMSG